MRQVGVGFHECGSYPIRLYLCNLWLRVNGITFSVVISVDKRFRED